jgi:hypothetical protein
MLIDGDEDWRYPETMGTLGRAYKHGVRPATVARAPLRAPLSVCLLGTLATVSLLLLYLLLQALA